MQPQAIIPLTNSYQYFHSVIPNPGWLLILAWLRNIL